MNIERFFLKFVKSEHGSLASNIVGVILAMFVMGAVGGTAFVMASNVTLYAGCPPAVTVLMTVGVPVIGGIAIMLYMIPKRGLALSPVLVAVSLGLSVQGWFVRLLHKLGRC
jgi:hypothetical protein